MVLIYFCVRIILLTGHSTGACRYLCEFTALFHEDGKVLELADLEPIKASLASVRELLAALKVRHDVASQSRVYATVLCNKLYCRVVLRSDVLVTMAYYCRF